MVLSVSDIAKHYGVSYRRALYAVNRGYIPSNRVGKTYLIQVMDLPRYFPTRSYVKLEG